MPNWAIENARRVSKDPTFLSLLKFSCLFIKHSLVDVYVLLDSRILKKLDPASSGQLNDCSVEGQFFGAPYSVASVMSFLLQLITTFWHQAAAVV